MVSLKGFRVPAVALHFLLQSACQFSEEQNVPIRGCCDSKRDYSKNRILQAMGFCQPKKVGCLEFRHCQSAIQADGELREVPRRTGRDERREAEELSVQVWGQE